MKKYGDVAIRASELLVKHPPKEAWQIAVEQVFSNSISSQQKGCPKSTFLGLCEVGLIKNSVPGKYTRSKLNKSYALKALNVLVSDPNFPLNAKLLWEDVVQGKKSNSQMDVVLALWTNNLIWREDINHDTN